MYSRFGSWYLLPYPLVRRTMIAFCTSQKYLPRPIYFPRPQMIPVVPMCIVRNRWRDGPRYAKDIACDIDTFPQQSCQRPTGKVLPWYSSVRLQHLLIIASVIFFLTKYEIGYACVLQGRLWFCRFTLSITSVMFVVLTICGRLYPLVHVSISLQSSSLAVIRL